METKTRNYTAELAAMALQAGWYGGKPLAVFLEAVPGTGKTTFGRKFAKIAADYIREELGVDAEFVLAYYSLPQTMPEDLAGMPGPSKDGHVVRDPMRDIRRLAESGWGIYIGDEMTSCSAATGAANMNIMLDQVAGDTHLARTSSFLGTLNPPECAAGAARDLSPPEVNRGLLLPWEVSSEDYFDYLRGGPGFMAHIRWLPKTWESDHTPLATEFVLKYLERNPTHRNGLRSGLTPDDQAGRPWPSERSWEMFIRLLAMIMSVGLDPNDQLTYLALQGTVGDGVADSFMTFIREFDLPSPREVMEVALDENSTDEDIRRAIPERVWARPDKTRMMMEACATWASRLQRAEGPEGESEYRAAWLAAGRIISPVLNEAPDNAMSAAQILASATPKGLTTMPDWAQKLFKAREAAGILKSRKRK